MCVSEKRACGEKICMTKVIMFEQDSDKQGNSLTERGNIARIKVHS